MEMENGNMVQADEEDLVRAVLDLPERSRMCLAVTILSIYARERDLSKYQLTQCMYMIGELLAAIPANMPK